MSETTEHPTLSEFLLERIAEDEATIAWTPVEIWPSRRRVLAECEAKRLIVERHQRLRERQQLGLRYVYACLQDLALVYTDHPDYREEWRP